MSAIRAGETPDDYWPVIRQIPALVHLEPPNQEGGSRIALDRFSPYFENPRLGFQDRRLAAFYTTIYQLPQTELDDLAYYFDCPDAGITGETEAALNQALATWARRFKDSYLYADTTAAGHLVITDERVGWPQRAITLASWRQLAYQQLHREQSLRGLQARLHAACEETGTPHRPPRR